LQKDDLYKKSEEELSPEDQERRKEALDEKDNHVDFLIRQFKAQASLEIKATDQDKASSSNPAPKRPLEEDEEEKEENTSTKK
jgi:hypothetical protein